ncbi:Complement component 1 Q subcomponent-binding protein_ mitochondrial, partial [Caligus rogercresseyi]
IKIVITPWPATFWTDLYDLLMNMLDERGVNSGLRRKLSSYCSAYEHSPLYQNARRRLKASL